MFDKSIFLRGKFITIYLAFAFKQLLKIFHNFGAFPIIELIMRYQNKYNQVPFFLHETVNHLIWIYIFFNKGLKMLLFIYYTILVKVYYIMAIITDNLFLLKAARKDLFVEQRALLY